VLLASAYRRNQSHFGTGWYHGRIIRVAGIDRNANVREHIGQGRKLLYKHTAKIGDSGGIREGDVYFVAAEALACDGKEFDAEDHEVDCLGQAGSLPRVK
jgi:hypothetical protein